MLGLSSIKEDIQNTAEAISAALKVDVTIVDENLVRIAGTGKYTGKVGESINYLSAFGISLAQGKGFIIENPRMDDVCKLCVSKESCKEFAEVCSPIVMDEKTYGVIGLVALDEEQEKSLKENKRELLTFLDKMGELISSKLKAQINSAELKAQKKKLETLIDTLDKGMILMDRAGVIEKYNKRFMELFELAGDIYGRNIADVLAFMKDSLTNIKSLEGEMISFTYSKNAMNGFYNVSPIYMDENVMGYVLDFTDSKQAMKSYCQMAGVDYEIKMDDIIGSSEEMTRIKAISTLAAKSPSTVLITGESGTGKEMFARAIHSSSQRRSQPFVAVNCAAIPENLLESELFGYEEGSFTGAKKGGKLGKFQLADNGTIFLDEIGDMSLHLQVKLLRVIQERVVERIGSSRGTKIDVKIICATNKDLFSMVREGTFREDLYYRLNVIPIHIPPLRQRKDDIEKLLGSMFKIYSKRFGRSQIELSGDAKELLLNYSWPGNVRELQNAVEYAINVAKTQVIGSLDLPSKVTSEENHECRNDDSRIMKLKDIERNEIQKAIRKFENMRNAKELVCQSLGISRATLYRKLKEYQL